MKTAADFERLMASAFGWFLVIGSLLGICLAGEELIHVAAAVEAGTAFIGHACLSAFWVFASCLSAVFGRAFVRQAEGCELNWLSWPRRAFARIRSWRSQR